MAETLPPIPEAAAVANERADETVPTPALSKKQARRIAEAPQRSGFVEGLINEDLKDLTKWHARRPHHEQKRFLKSVDMLYKAYSTAGGKTADQTQAAMTQGIAKQVPLQQSASAPSLPSTKPINVFEQRKRDALRKSKDDYDEENTLNKWLEGASMSSCTTGTTAATSMTRFSQLSKTTIESSICSEPGTTHRLQFRAHKRAFQANRNVWSATDQHAPAYLKDGIPTVGMPDSERMLTMFQSEFGKGQFGEKISKEMYSNIFNEGQHSFVDKFIENAPPEDKSKFTGMVRSLQFLRREHRLKNSTVTKEGYNLAENQRLFKPSKQKPVFEPAQANLSTVPLGTIGQVKGKNRIKLPPPDLSGVPVSPSVSGLGSLPLTPRSVATPLVGGVDLPMASAPSQDMSRTF